MEYKSIDDIRREKLHSKCSREKDFYCNKYECQTKDINSRCADSVNKAHIILNERRKMENNKSKIYATALLSDGEILFWKTGQSEKSKYDFYKDFYRSSMSQTEYFESHEMTTEVIAFEFEDKEENSINNFVFNVLAKEFFKLYPISKDSKGAPPYGE